MATEALLIQHDMTYIRSFNELPKYQRWITRTILNPPLPLFFPFSTYRLTTASLIPSPFF